MTPELTNNIAGRNWHPKDMSKAVTLDRDLVVESFSWPFWAGIPLRFLFASFGLWVVGLAVYFLGWWALVPTLPFLPLMSNRLEPMPAGKNDKKHMDWPAWMRWYWWHIRNPGEDLKKYFLGFGGAKRVSHWDLWNNDWNFFRFWLARFGGFPVPVPFPYFKHQKGLELMWGWKSRGLLSITIRAND